MEINKMNEKKLLHIQIENKLKEVQNLVSLFDSKFDQRTRADLPICWDQQGNLLSWEQYERELVVVKRRADATHENTAILNGRIVVNYLQRDFKLLWPMKTLFVAKPDYTKLSNLQMIQCQLPDEALFKKCESLITPIEG